MNVASRCIIAQACITHVYALANNLREGDRQEVEATGFDPRKGLRRMMRHSLRTRVALVDGQVAAMWGVGGSALSDEGYPWLLTSSAIERIPFTLVREARREVLSLLEWKPMLIGYVLASYERSVKFLSVLGFEIDEAMPFGPKQLPHRKFWMTR